MKFLIILYLLSLHRRCCNNYMVNHPGDNGLERFPWYLWGQRSQMLFSPCAKECRDFNPFAGRFQYLMNSSTQKCNDCLIKNVRYPWHMFTRTRIEDTYVWKILNEKIDNAESALKDATNRGWYKPKTQSM